MTLLDAPDPQNEILVVLALMLRMSSLQIFRPADLLTDIDLVDMPVACIMIRTHRTHNQWCAGQLDQKALWTTSIFPSSISRTKKMADGVRI